MVARLSALLAALAAGPDAVDPPVCRVGMVPGPDPAWDACGTTCDGAADGQLWATLATVGVDDASTCLSLTATGRVGVLRCAAVVDEHGNPPSAEDVALDVAQQALDADAILAALLIEDFKHTFTVVSWTPLGPSGGCVGGYWEISANVGVC